MTPPEFGYNAHDASYGGPVRKSPVLDQFKVSADTWDEADKIAPRLATERAGGQFRLVSRTLQLGDKE